MPTYEIFCYNFNQESYKKRIERNRCIWRCNLGIESIPGHNFLLLLHNQMVIGSIVSGLSLFFKIWDQNSRLDEALIPTTPKELPNIEAAWWAACLLATWCTFAKLYSQPKSISSSSSNNKNIIKKQQQPWHFPPRKVVFLLILKYSCYSILWWLFRSQNK